MKPDAFLPILSEEGLIHRTVLWELHQPLGMFAVLAGKVQVGHLLIAQKTQRD